MVKNHRVNLWRKDTMIELQNEDNKNVKINVKNRKLLKGGVYGF
jgi:hypothetical protein